jgi:hypothetical protein
MGGDRRQRLGDGLPDRSMLDHVVSSIGRHLDDT